MFGNSGSGFRAFELEDFRPSCKACQTTNTKEMAMMNGSFSPWAVEPAAARCGPPWPWLAVPLVAIQWTLLWPEHFGKWNSLVSWAAGMGWVPPQWQSQGRGPAGGPPPATKPSYKAPPPRGVPQQPNYPPPSAKQPPPRTGGASGFGVLYGQRVSRRATTRGICSCSTL